MNKSTRRVLGVVIVAMWLGIASRAEASIILNEVLGNPGGQDVNQDGVVHIFQDEFIELVNTGPAPISLEGWSLFDAVMMRHLFDATSVIPAGEFFVVFGGGTPIGFSHVATASTGTLGLNNTGGETITLFDPSAALIDTFSYGTALTGQSFTRFPDGAGPFVGHLTASSVPFSPGTTVDGSSQLQGDNPAIPEPSPFLLLGSGLLGLVFRQRPRAHHSP